MAILRNKIFKPLYTTKKRYILVTGGRGGAKSFEICVFLCLLTYEKFRNILFTRWTMKSAEISIIPEFTSKIEALEVPNQFKVNSDNITNVNGSELLFRGIKASSGMQTANLKSIPNISCWVNDESEELVDENVFDTIDLSVRSLACHNYIILILNPSNKNHWIYKRWIENTHEIRMIDGYPVEISTHPDVLHIHTTYLDNLKHLAASWIENVQSLKITSPKTYGHKVIGQWNEVAEGSLFIKSKMNTFKNDDNLIFESSIAYIDVADEGDDYTCMFVGKNIGARIYITDIIFTNKNTDVSIPLCVESIKRNECRYARVESNSMGAMFKRNLEKLLTSCQCLSAASTTNKHTRIIMDSVFIMENFYFRHESERSPMYESALTQMNLYTFDGKAKHDDSADAASGLAIFIRAMLAKYYV